MFDDAIATTKLIDKGYQYSKALSTIAENLAKSGNIARASLVFEDVFTTAKLINNDFQRSIALAIIAQKQSKVGKGIEVKSTINAAIASTMLIASSDRSRVLSDIIKAQAEAGMFDEAIATTKLIDDRYNHSKLLADIAKIQAETGLFEAATTLAK